MRIKFTLVSQKKIVLKTGYSEVLQAVIYGLLDKLSGDWLHEEGFEHKKRFFKLFCYSEILEKGKYNGKTREFHYPSQINFLISSPIDWILEQIAKNGIMKTEINLGGNIVQLSSIEVTQPPKQIEGKTRITALTPIEVHSTLEKKDGTKKTYYYSPKEKEFSSLINENLKKKWKACYKEECNKNIKIYPVNIIYNKEKIRNFKGTIIKGWTGHYYLEGDTELIKFALDTGLGSRNSAGFGMVEVVGRRY